jgi:hypothetical protein
MSAVGSEGEYKGASAVLRVRKARKSTPQRLSGQVMLSPREVSQKCLKLI